MRFMAAEAEALRPGGETVVTRLADILVIQTIRAWLAHAPEARTGWLGALQDPQVGRALVLIHRDPARDWTLAALAKEAAMSRSAFAARFTQRVGMPAMQYLVHWRMQVAASLLREEDAGLADVAGRMGYQSEAAFSRAFKRCVGVAPGTFRRDGGLHGRMEKGAATGYDTLVE
ncbi:helix-turn-helix transcriptional regulator [Corallococcus llansteffanensis]|uniref:helix-turn-helix transcriptional regulator n=1 Tax=Corallococcus llansteffanensis TaxID=2316731 RepID=UPI001FC9FD92|nr:AraC family transcriptional regulator [Corallococcus llansteffanensis]